MSGRNLICEAVTDVAHQHKDTLRSAFVWVRLESGQLRKILWKDLLERVGQLLLPQI